MLSDAPVGCVLYVVCNCCFVHGAGWPPLHDARNFKKQAPREWKMDNSLLAVRDTNHKSIVVGGYYESPAAE